MPRATNKVHGRACGPMGSDNWRSVCGTAGTTGAAHAVTCKRCIERTGPYEPKCAGCGAGLVHVAGAWRCSASIAMGMCCAV